VRLSTLEEGAGRFKTIYLDPPWSYHDSTCTGAAAKQYPTMSLDELKKLRVPELAAEDGACFWCWATWPKIRDRIPHELLDHWGLRWVGEIVWDKKRIGPGRWLRSQAEVLILAVSGKPERTAAMRRQGNIFKAPDLPEVIESPRINRHSEKPQEFRTLVESLSPGPRIELFARTAAPGWDVWGDQAPSPPADLRVSDVSQLPIDPVDVDGVVLVEPDDVSIP